MIESYPLSWPQGYPRTKKQKSSQFQVSMSVARDELLDELRRLGARNVIISTNVATYERGGRQIPYADQKVEDTGVAVYFEWEKEQHVIACDRWKSLDGNMRAIGLTVSALRGLERWGATDILKRTFSGLKQLPEQGSGRPWWVVLGVERDAPVDELKSAYRRRAKETHPDFSEDGSSEAFREVRHAWSDAQSDRGTIVD